MDLKGQIALEYLLMFFVILIIFSVISIPFITGGIENINDLTETIEVKSSLIEIGNNIKLFYPLDVGSKRTFSVYVPANIVLYYTTDSSRHYIYTTLTLSDNTKKRVQVEVPCKISFNGNANHYYSSLKKRWYYNTEVKWLTSSNGERSINIKFE